VRRSHYRDGDHREHTGEATEVSEPMHAVVSFV
jgi:hypothetical protein